MKKINLALQGGGSHGAFTWGVLDRLFEETKLEIEGVSGTSAGAMNASVAAHGYSVNGREGARKSLKDFWTSVGQAARVSIFKRSVWDVFAGNWNIDGSPGPIMAGFLQHMISPYQSNPLNLSPLRDVLQTSIDLDAIRRSPLKIFISATNVKTGRSRVFNRDDISMEAILASACLPLMFKAVDIEGEPYWDGGFTGNPCIWPLIYDCDSQDVAIIQINPLIREGTPEKPSEILNRMQELSFNSSLMAEMRAITFVEKLIKEDHLSGSEVNRYKKMHIHRIHAEAEMRKLGVSSKLNAEPDFLTYLFELGRHTADTWLKVHYEDLGHKSSINIVDTYL